MSVRLFSTCVQSVDVPADEYVAEVGNVARWSEQTGCAGMLIYTDNRLVDPWLVAQIAMAHTRNFMPLVAVQPIYMHPYAVANMVASLGLMYGRRMMLNMVAGGFKGDLIALNDQTPHDDRYVRLVEYTRIIQELLARSSEKKPFSFEGKYYSVKNLALTPALSPELQPGVFVSGSSTSGLAAARAMNAVAVQYPTSPDEFGNVSLDEQFDYGIRIGIIARDNEDDAWKIAEERFPSDRAGNLTRQLAAKVSDSHWHKNLMDQVRKSSGGREPYWLVPFQHYKTMCPYLVGTYDSVAAHVQTYLDKGYHTVIMDIPPNLEELEHTAEVFKRCKPGA